MILLALGIAFAVAAVLYATHMHRIHRRATKRPGYITDQWRNQ